MFIGYRRVSAGDQNLDRQLDGLTLDKIFQDVGSGKDMARPELAKCIEFVREGDKLFVHSIDRLARSLRDLHELVDRLCSKGAEVFFVKENLTFKVGSQDALDKLLFSILGAFAEFERNLIRERQREGIAAAQRKGKKFGRPKKLTQEVEAAIMEDFRNGELASEISRKYGISAASAYALKAHNKIISL
jgi:DNA invertase Pin-like site-specific DNA recombinase